MLKKITRVISLEILIFLLLTVVVGFVLAKYVNLTPQVDGNFFFSTNDPQLQAEKRISELFQRRDTQLIISAEGNIMSFRYLKKIKGLSAKISLLPEVASVISISTGPKTAQTAIKSPLWRRLLIADNEKSTNIIVVLTENRIETTLQSIEELTAKANADDFTLRISGAPYIAKLIQRNLSSDFIVFSLLTLLIFTLLILLVFRSLVILGGTLLTCLNASMLTLIATHLLNIQIGVLTANLATIVFVLTLSHIVFLTYNCKHSMSASSRNEIVKESINYTFSPSFWSMFTTALGFLSLILVPAKPLRELGMSGALGAIIAMGIAYTVYPVFLRKVSWDKSKVGHFEEAEHFIYRKVKGKSKYFVYTLITLSIVMLPGLGMIKHDPSIFSYFKKNGEISRGLRYIDRNGGSNPLIIVVKTESGTGLNTTESYNQLWGLQTSLENHKDVGSVISLPVLMAQAKQNPLLFFLKWEWLLEIMEKPAHNEIAKSFITDDRKNGLFLLRMKEANRSKTRLEIIEELKKIAQDNGFIPEIVGGVYALQGRLSKLVLSSLVFGLFRLLMLFFIISFIVSLSLPVSLAMTLSICIIPLIVLGCVGIIKIPLDIIAAPSINIAIGMGIDSMIHMVRYFRSIRDEKKTDKEKWEEVRKRLWDPILITVTIITLGFGVFLFSQFPPTQRFGAIIVFGSMLAGLTALYIMPWFICGVFSRKPKKA